MSGFSFGTGNNTATPVPGSQVVFGTNKTQTTSSGFNLGGGTTVPGSHFGAASTQPSGLTFGSPATTMTSGLNFGSIPNTQVNTSLSFGSSLGQTSGVSFGASSLAPSTTSTFGNTPVGSTGLSFGSAPSGQLTGQAGLSGLSFGSAQSGQSTGISFGSMGGNTTTAQSLSFGAPVAAVIPTLGTSSQAGFSFGPSTQTTSAFGATSTTPSTGLNFGGPTATATATGLTFGTTTPSVSIGLNFGGPTATATATGLTFGTTTPSVTTGLNFGGPTATATATGLTFGTTTPAVSTGLNFGGPTATATATGLTFGTTTPAVSTGLTFGTTAQNTSLGMPAPTTMAAKPLTLSFGAPTATSTVLGLSLPTSTQSAGFNLGNTASTGPFGNLNMSKPLLLGQPPASTATSLNFGGNVLPTSAPNIGLGGVDSLQSKSGATNAGKTDRAVKENLVPNEIMQTIEGFKSFMKMQKSVSSDIARGSAKPLHKVQEDTESLRQMVTSIKSGLQRNKALADRLKADTAKSIHDVEMAQRTHDTPPGLQYDNVAPLQYFSELVANFENEMQTFRQEIENAEKHLQSLCEPIALTPQELSLAMRHLHDSFVALAGRLQTVHNSVEAQKEQYLNLRKYFLKDPTNVFEEAKKLNVNTMKPIVPTRISLGPTPFSPMGNQQRFGLLPAVPSESTASFPAGKPLGK